MNDCWNTIGIRGDGSCQELKQHVHCRNCPVYSASAVELLEVPAPDGYVAEWTDHLARPKRAVETDSDTVMIFRLGSEWLALPTQVIQEVANPRPVHSIPHRRGAVIGLTNVRGELLVCASLPAILGLTTNGSNGGDTRVSYPRLMVIRREDVRAACPVDEIHGVHRFHPGELRDIPSTVKKATTRYSRSLLEWQERSVGVLDDRLLFQSLRRSVA